MDGPTYKRYLIFGDESCTHGGSTHYAFGTLWIPNEARGRLSGILNDLRLKHRNDDEVKWTRISKSRQAFYVDLVEEFFRKNWIMFHALIIRKAVIDGDKDLDRRKKFAMLLRDKVTRFASVGRNKYYDVRVDPLPSRYLKAGEAAHVIVNRAIKKKLGYEPITSLETVKDSKESAGIQIVDVLLGAFMSGWHEDEVADPKRAVRDTLLRCLGWHDARADTPRDEWKYNVWLFHDPVRGTREVRQRRVDLLYPVVPYRAASVGARPSPL